MSLRDTQQGYSWLSIALHWIVAVSVITLWLIAEFSEDLPKPERIEMMKLHVSIAMTVYIILWGRIFWRMGNPRPQLPQQHPILNQLAKWIPIVLLLGIAIMLISGPLMIWGNGNSIVIFDVINLPSPMSKNHQLHEWGEEMHELGANILLFGVGLHVLGAIKHLVINKQNILTKMLIPGNK